MAEATALPVNYDEALAGIPDLPPLSPDPSRALVSSPEEARAAQAAWRTVFARGLFGEVPESPEMAWRRLPLAEPRCEQIAITLSRGGQSFEVDAALWLPAKAAEPLPIIVGLDFLGPLGALAGTDYPLDANAVVALPGWLGGGHGPLSEVMRGTAPHRFPAALLADAGYAVLTSCYGSWVPDDRTACRRHGLWPLLGLDEADAPPGVVALWSLALRLLVDIAAALPEIDAGRISLAGHSRLGKAALWAAANDERVSALFLNESGCGGAALTRRNFGESFAHNRRSFPHWLLSEARAAAAGLDAVDQHQLLALMAPRRLYVASAADDLWCDPRGEYLGLRAAAPLWSVFVPMTDLPEAEAVFSPGNGLALGPLGWHLRAGGHELTPYDWRRFLAFMAAADRDGR